MNDERSLVPMNYKEMIEFSKIVLKSRMFNSMKSAEQCLLTMIAGREMGMGFIEACNSIYLVNGKVSLFYPKVGELIKRSGKYDYKVKEHTNVKCVIEFLQKSLDGTKWESIGESVYTMEDASKANLSGDNWTKYPRNMLFARALTNGAKWYTPDVFGGAIYEPEELGAKIKYADDGETVEEIIIPSDKPSWTQPVDKLEPPIETPVETPTETSTVKPKDDSNVPILEIDTESSTPTKKVMKVAEFIISSFTEIESQRKAGIKYGKVTFDTFFDLPEGVTARWPEYTVSPFVFDDKPEMYRALESHDKVSARITFELKSTPDGDKNYQNVEVIMRYPTPRKDPNEEEEQLDW